MQSLGQLESLLQGGRIDLPQVEEFRQRIETNRALLIQSENAFQSTLDDFKTDTLALPPDVEFVLDDSLIQQFQFIDRSAVEIQNDLAILRSELGDLPQEAGIAEVQPMVQRAAALLDRVDAYLVTVPQDFITLRSAMAERMTSMPADEQATFEADIETNVFQNWETDVVQQYPELQPGLEMVELAMAGNDVEGTFNQLVSWLGALNGLLNRATLVQARARVESVVLEPFDIAAEVALEIARANRVDWANNRAALVDTWRLIQFNADALQSDFDVVFSGDIRTQGNNPIAFRGPTGTLRAGFQFDAPFTRLLERNNFRQSLIDYQQARRSLIQFEDGVHTTMRAAARQLEQLQLNMEIQRRAAVIAIRRVDLTREDLNRPPAPTEPGAAPATDPTAAQRLGDAITDLGNAQNQFMSVWLNQYALRMQLVRDLGLMELDENGMWIERPLEFATVEEMRQMELESHAMPPEIPLEWFDLVPEDLQHENGSAEDAEARLPEIQPSVRPDDLTAEVSPTSDSAAQPPLLLTPPEVQALGALDPKSKTPNE